MASLLKRRHQFPSIQKEKLKHLKLFSDLTDRMIPSHKNTQKQSESKEDHIVPNVERPDVSNLLTPPDKLIKDHCIDLTKNVNANFAKLCAIGFPTCTKDHILNCVRFIMGNDAYYNCTRTDILQSWRENEDVAFIHMPFFNASCYIVLDNKRKLNVGHLVFDYTDELHPNVIWTDHSPGVYNRNTLKV